MVKKIGFMFLLTAVLGMGNAQYARALNIKDVTIDKQEVRKYEKIEIKFKIEGSGAESFDFPYDPQTIAGLKSRTGITVDGLMQKSGSSEWVVQPAFWYQPMMTDRSKGDDETEWMHPSGEGYWLIRFTPTTEGDWKFKIRAQDGTICNIGVNPCQTWVESEVGGFRVTALTEEKNGFVRVSGSDSRYFEFSSGKPFVGMGFEYDFLTEKMGDIMDKFRENGINFIRSWMSKSTITGRGTHSWNAWWDADKRVSTEEVYPGHDFSYKLSGNGDFVFNFANPAQKIGGGLEAGKKYKIRLRAKVKNLETKSGGSSWPSGLVVALRSPWASYGQSGYFELGQHTKAYLLPSPIKGSGEWQIYEGEFVNNLGRVILDSQMAVGIGLQEVSDGSVAYIDELVIAEDLGDGKLGHNILFKGQVNYHLYFDQLGAAHWDKLIEKAENSGVYLRPVILEKNDAIYDRIRVADGVFDMSVTDPGIRNNNFYARENSRVRRLHEYYWRYIVARWGYSTAIHSWELLNEGDPFNGNHRAQVEAMSKFMKENNPSQQLVGSSNWHSFPKDFWASSNYPNISHGDFHAYNNASGAYSYNVAELDNPALAGDMALYHTVYSNWAFSQGINKPIVRGEAGIFSDTEEHNNNETSELAKDTKGVWLHNYVWSQVDSGGVYELYWWTENIRNKPGPDGNSANGLYEIYTPFGEFMKNIAINDGTYTTLSGVVESSNARFWGQRNNKSGKANRAHLWIQNKEHTWKRVVDGQGWNRLEGKIVLSGFEENKSFPIDWWEFDEEIKLTRRGTIISSDNNGRIVIDLDSLGNVVVDFGVKIGEYEEAVTINCESCHNMADKSKGDANCDSQINMVDFVIWRDEYRATRKTTERRYDWRADFNCDGRVNMTDLTVWRSEYMKRR